MKKKSLYLTAAALLLAALASWPLLAAETPEKIQQPDKKTITDYGLHFTQTLESSLDLTGSPKQPGGTHLPQTGFFHLRQSKPSPVHVSTKFPQGTGARLMDIELKKYAEHIFERDKNAAAQLDNLYSKQKSVIYTIFLDEKPSPGYLSVIYYHFFRWGDFLPMRYYHTETFDLKARKPLSLKDIIAIEMDAFAAHLEKNMDAKFASSAPHKFSGPDGAPLPQHFMLTPSGLTLFFPQSPDLRLPVKTIDLPKEALIELGVPAAYWPEPPAAAAGQGQSQDKDKDQTDEQRPPQSN